MRVQYILVAVRKSATPRMGNITKSMKAFLVTLYRRLNCTIIPTSRLWRYGLILTISVFTLSTFIQSILTPPFEGSDEQRHYAYARYLANYQSLPPRIWSTDTVEYYTYKVGQEAGQPPLYYIPVALLTSLVPNADDAANYVTRNPFVSPSDDAGAPYDNHNYYLHSTENNFPFRSVALAVRLGRLISITAGVFTLLGVYGIGRAFVPQQPAIALLATLMIACVPGISFIHSVITNDTAVILFATLSIWIAVRIAREGATLKLASLGGLFAGLTVLSKINGIWVVGVVWLALLTSAFLHRREQPLKSALLAFALSVTIWLAITGWWLVNGIAQDGDPLGISIHVVQPGQTILGYLKLDLSFFSLSNLATWDRTTWYSTSWTLIQGPGWVYETFRYFYLVGIIGFIGLCLQSAVRLTRHSGDTLSRRAPYVEIVQATCVALAVLCVIAFAYFWQLTGRSHLGRYLYPGLTSAAVLGAIGWAWWVGWLRKLRAPQATYWAFAVVIFVLLQHAALWGVSNTITALLPHSITTAIPDDATQTQVTYLDPTDSKTPVAQLIGYHVHAQDLRAGSAMYADLCWKSLGYTQANFPYTLQLVGPNDSRPGTRNSFHGLGSYPMSAWKPGEEFCDQTSVNIAFTANRPRAYNLVVTLFSNPPPDYKLGPPLPAVDASGRSVYPLIGRVRVAPVRMPIVTPTISLGDVAGLAGASIDLFPTNTLSITLRWTALSSPSVNAKVFLHVVDKGTGQVIAQSDHEPDGGWFPTDYWQKGDVIDDQFQINLPAGADPNAIDLRLGMYDSQSQARLAAVDLATQQRFADDAIPLKP